MDYQIFDATIKPVPGVRVFLDGVDVTNVSFYAYVPTEPGVEAHGTIGMYTQWPPLLTEDENDLQTEYKTGQVYWVQKAVN